jgi:hypothetical protein
MRSRRQAIPAPQSDNTDEHISDVACYAPRRVASIDACVIRQVGLLMGKLAGQLTNSAKDLTMAWLYAAARSSASTVSSLSRPRIVLPSEVS